MTESDETTQRESTKRRKVHRPKKSRPLGRAWTEWRTEIIILLVVALAIFLLVERMQIRQTIFAWLRAVARGLGGLLDGTVQGVSGLIQRTTLSDLIGYGLLLLVSVLVTWRLRWRLMHAARFTTKRCPLCQSGLQRVHRRWSDRLLNLYLPVRRYRCGAPTCDWSGLRIGHNRP